jgi:transglutaminase-like putative cysteine protease
LAGLLALSAVRAAADEASASAGFTRDATVVVLVGLPGDLDSERAYDEHLRRVLEILALPDAKPKRVLVLVDEPARVQAPPGLELVAHPNGRDELVRVARELAASPGPRVLLAFGHAGSMGRAPVFHVRGPRVTPDDLGLLAHAGQPFQALLFFRGSGVFARALAGAQTRLTSDRDRPFGSDPVALEVWLRLWRAEPGADLVTLARRLGPGVEQWYAGQGLVRTEEPTLWPAQGAPQALAAAALGPPGVTPAAAARAVDSRVPPSPEPTGPTLVEAWQGIQSVDPGRYPGEHALVLRRVRRVTLAQRPAVVEERDEFIQVLTVEGAALGNIDESFSPPDERLTFLDCEVRRPDGRVVRFDPEAFGVQAEAPEGEYRVPARRAFPLPDVVPGAVLRVHTRREWQSFPMPHVLLELPLGERLPVLDTQLEVTAPAEAPLHTALLDAPAHEPERRASRYGQTRVWRLRDLAPAGREALTRPERVPRVVLSTFPDWAEFAAWYRRLVREADVSTPEIQAQARALTAGLATPRARAAALSDFVTRLRYVALPFGVNSHRPHAAARVLAQRYGDCKDKANLLNALARAVGLEAQLVLVPRFGQAYAELPGAGFNHALSRLRLDGRWVYVDSTDEVARFGFLPPGDAGRRVLPIAEDVDSLVELPLPEASGQRLVVRTRVQPGPEAAAAWRMRLEATAEGLPDYDLRSAARQTPPASTQPLLAASLRPTLGGLHVTSQRHSSPSALEQAFTWQAEGDWAGLGLTLPARAGAPATTLVRAPFWLPAEWDSALHARTSRLFLNQGYPLTLDQQVEIELPPGTRTRLPTARASTQGPLRFRLEWSAPAPGRLRAALTLTLERAEVELEDVEPLQATLRALHAAVAEGALYEQP